MCVNEIIGFREIWTALHTWLGADSYLADWEILQMEVNRGEILKLQRTRIPAISKEEGNIINLHKQKLKTSRQDKILCRTGCEALEI